MNYLLTGMVLFWFSTAVAQIKVDEVAGQINTGVGISNKPGTIFGTPFFFSGDISFFFSNQWRLSAEGGITSFRDAEYPTQKIGLLFAQNSRYQHSYAGLIVGRNLLSRSQASRLLLLTGADYLSVTEPGVQPSGGWLGGYSFHYQQRSYLNIPVQVDYSIDPFGAGLTRLSINGRWNLNPYHAFPTISVGMAILFYNRHQKRPLSFDGTIRIAHPH